MRRYTGDPVEYRCRYKGGAGHLVLLEFFSAFARVAVRKEGLCLLSYWITRIFLPAF